MLDYSPTLTDHFLNPRNRGLLEDANALGQAGSVRTGDALRLMLRIESGIVAAARFQSTGSGPDIAAASALSECVIGKTLAEARAITAAQVETLLGGLPESERSSARVAADALAAALGDYAQPPAFRAAKGNRAAVPLAIAPLTPTAPRPLPASTRCLDSDEETAAARAVLARMRPQFQADGGDVELVDIIGPRVRVLLKGSCSGCQLAGLTLGGLQKRLADALGRAVLVVPVPARSGDRP
ncbi:modular FeS cluster scaffolding protein NifU [Rhodovulum bhavnagarense]|uniref:Nitrogen fixation protein NifU n=1 Tax=Rhodovulum bhavnagarense TaxID=992286 RepID=A0A4R2RDY6_9RHOB|nr:iron-sulfur cluster assembly scaffold protein [Rhodovulum bhavnagarense]TCP61700.1 modular FeS cluster scaffolding protein NifU [Rhodovulum bhavnagarense]